VLNKYRQISKFFCKVKKQKKKKKQQQQQKKLAVLFQKIQGDKSIE
jgi:hypothetical protein